MITKRYIFRIAATAAVCFAALCASAGNLATERTARRLDMRVHEGYVGLERLIPTHVKLQYAGGMGVVSFGAGWDYGRKCCWETDVMIGFLPRAYADRFHTTLTLRQNYSPWSIRCGGRFAFEPFACGVYLNFISGERFWMREPARYPGEGYYGFTSRLRIHLYVGQRLTLNFDPDAAVRAVTLYYELSANDLNIVAKFGNSSLRVSDIVFFSAGVKLQIFKP